MFDIRNAKLANGSLTLTDSRALLQSPQALPLLLLETTDCTAIIALQGAQLLQFAPRGQNGWLHLPPDCDFTEGKPIDGGIPLCLPWFGRPANNQWPIHGYLRQQNWLIDDVASDEYGACIQLRYRHAPTAMYPYHFEAVHRLQLSHQIRLTLTLHNHDQQPIPLSWAWHSYFKVSDTASAFVHDLHQHTFLNNLHGLQSERQQGIIHFDHAVDAVFEGTQQPQMLYNGTRNLQLSGQHCPSCIVWQPGAGSNDFICVERGCAFADSLLLAAGASHTATMTIKESV